MARLIDAAAERVAPWRGPDWRVLVGEGVLLIVAGLYLLADGERAEFVLGLLVAAALLIDGVRRWRIGFRLKPSGRPRDATLIRGAVGIVTGGLVLLLMLVGQITVLGIRIAIGLGGFAYAALGLLLFALSVRNRQALWTAVVYDILLILVAGLLLYRVATAESVAGLLGITTWLVLGAGLVIVVAGARRGLTLRGASTHEGNGGSPG